MTMVSSNCHQNCNDVMMTLVLELVRVNEKCVRSCQRDGAQVRWRRCGSSSVMMTLMSMKLSSYEDVCFCFWRLIVIVQLLTQVCQRLSHRVDHRAHSSGRQDREDTDPQPKTNAQHHAQHIITTITEIRITTVESMIVMIMTPYV